MYSDHDITCAQALGIPPVCDKVLMTLVKKADVDTLKDGWLTDNVSTLYLNPGYDLNARQVIAFWEECAFEACFSMQ